MPLSKDVLDRLLTMGGRQERRKKRDMTGVHDAENEVADEGWMTPLNRIIWLKAFKSRQTRVKIRDGREFIVNYDVPFKGLDGEDLLHIKPVGTTLVPRGYFPIRDVTHLHWLKDGKS